MIYDFTVQDTQGNMVEMKKYAGKVLLIVNTATGCGFTPQYEGLEALYQAYGQKGFEILDFPCNQFKNQAPGTNEELAQFCQLKYNTTFQTFAKIDVKGAQAHPLFTYLCKESKGLLGGAVKWNFTKFLVDRQGHVAGRFGPQVTPEKIAPEIEALLS